MNIVPASPDKAQPLFELTKSNEGAVENSAKQTPTSTPSPVEQNPVAAQTPAAEGPIKDDRSPTLPEPPKAQPGLQGIIQDKEQEFITGIVSNQPGS